MRLFGRSRSSNNSSSPFLTRSYPAEYRDDPTSSAVSDTASASEATLDANSDDEILRLGSVDNYSDSDSDGQVYDADVDDQHDISSRERGTRVTLPRFARPRKHPVFRYVPPGVRRTWKKVVKWTKGPQPPRPFRIEGFFAEWQELPLRWVDAHLPKRRHKVWALIFFYAAWILCFSLVQYKSAFAGEIKGYGPPVRLSCLSRLWRDGTGCGLNGDSCRPFDNSSFAFRCPAFCSPAVVFNPHAVGDQEIVYRPLVVGGPTDLARGVESAVYRADSFICSAAIHSGFLDDATGGCGVLKMVGEREHYPSIKNHGIESVGFDSHFPRTYTFEPGSRAQCRDLRWALLGVSLPFTIILSLATASPAVFFASMFVSMFFHVALASDPPNFADYHDLISTALGRFLPAAFCAYAMYVSSIRRTLSGLTAQVEKTILWLGPCWVGAFNNYTFDKIPIQRLTPHDIKQQPGAVPALITIVLTLLAIALGQAWCFRIEGRMPRYLAIYAGLVAGLLALVAVPHMNVRIHHYILALLLLPGTAMQTRLSLVYQGLLVGFFLNGTARWGFDSILQTPGELREDGPVGTLLPAILPPVVHLNRGIAGLAANITFSWRLPGGGSRFPGAFDGISALVNDVERFRAYKDRGVDEGSWRSFTWRREHLGVDEFFRFAYMQGSVSGDYTKAGVWKKDGGWVEMEDGPGL